MSETLFVGQPVVCRDSNGELVASRGVGIVTDGDLSHVTVAFGPLSAKVNAGSIRLEDWTISAMTQADSERFSAMEVFEKRLALDSHKVSDLQCETCLWWRPPFDTGPGNCHHEQVKQLTNIGGETYAPPTPAHFGCVQWESKAQPENGDE